jgi:hypothetical protein
MSTPTPSEKPNYPKVELSPDLEFISQKWTADQCDVMAKLFTQWANELRVKSAALRINPIFYKPL